jgi:hypothetical protein
MSLLEAPQTVAGFSVGDTAVWNEGSEVRRDVVRSVDQNGVTTPTRRLEWRTPGLRREPPPTTAIAPAEAPDPEDAPIALADLSDEEAQELAERELVIAANLHRIKESLDGVGDQLGPIQEKKLYRGEHPTFAAYCREEWNLGKAYAYQLIQATKTRALLAGAEAKVLPESERQTRPLNPIPDDQKAQVWDRAVEIAGGEQPTGQEVAQAADEVRYDYDGWDLEALVYWTDADGNLRAGLIKQLWGGRLLIQSTDGGLENQRISVEPTQARDARTRHGVAFLEANPPTPFGRCDHLLPEGVSDPDGACGKPAVAPNAHEYAERLCKEHAAQREAAQRAAAQRAAAQRIADMAAAGGVGEITGQLITSAGAGETAPELTLEPSPVVRTAAQIAEENATARIAKSGALKTAEEKVAERAAVAAEPPKPAPVTFPLMPDMVERLKTVGIQPLPGLRYACLIGEWAKERDTPANLFMMELQAALKKCADNGRSLNDTVDAGLLAMDAGAIEEVPSVSPDSKEVVALTIDCPVCDAPAGASCIWVNPKFTFSHSERIIRAEDHPNA